MKIGIVGSGSVGATAGYALAMQGIGREIAHGKGATYYGSGSALARIVEVICMASAP